MYYNFITRPVYRYQFMNMYSTCIYYILNYILYNSDICIHICEMYLYDRTNLFKSYYDHVKPFIIKLCSRIISDNPPRRLNCKYLHDLLNTINR